MDRKLRLRKETFRDLGRQLDAEALARVAGGHTEGYGCTRWCVDTTGASLTGSIKCR